MTIDRDPRREYEQRQQARRRNVARFENRENRISILRLAAAIAFLIAAWASLWRGAIGPRWLVVPALTFLALVVIHDRISRLKWRAQRAVEFYEDGIARIEDRWIGRGQSTEAWRSDSHLYAADLDIFGKASLFELLSTARMRSGEETLAAWLAGPAGRNEIVERQQAVEELRNRVDLREDIAILGTSIRTSIHPEFLMKWGRSERVLNNRTMRIALPVLASITIPLLFTSFWPYILAVDAAVGLFYRRRVRSVMEAVERPEKELSLLAQILARIEREQFTSPRLVALRRALDTDGLPPSRQIGRLARMMDMLNWRRNELFAVFSVFVFWASQITFAVEAWRSRCGLKAVPWLNAAGEFEALCALSGYAYEHPDDPFPEIVERGPVFEGEELKHPLVPAAQCIPNSVNLGGSLQMLVVSGSNMSGKSTLLRTVGINAVLALAGAPVRARSLRISPLEVGATLRIQDSLQAGTSRFYAEIQRIHHIMERTKGPLPVLFLLDEVLHGTNSHDRAVGAEAIVKGLVGRGAIGLVTTHDLALARVAETLSPRAANVHFEDEMIGGKMVFDYRMHPGVVRKSNALALMRAVGLEV